MNILRTERLVAAGRLRLQCFLFGSRLLFHLIESDGRFQHQQNIKPLLTDVLHYFGDLLGFGDRFVNGFSQLLDETTESLVQWTTPSSRPA